MRKHICKTPEMAETLSELSWPSLPSYSINRQMVKLKLWMRTYIRVCISLGVLLSQQSLFLTVRRLLMALYSCKQRATRQSYFPPSLPLFSVLKVLPFYSMKLTDDAFCPTVCQPPTRHASIQFCLIWNKKNCHKCNESS